jgi:hypothetical protein
METLKKEFIVWGIPKGDKNETILSTKCDNLKEAKYMCNYFENVFKATKTRVQIIDFTKPLENDFKNDHLIKI